MGIEPGSRRYRNDPRYLLYIKDLQQLQVLFFMVFLADCTLN